MMTHRFFGVTRLIGVTRFLSGSVTAAPQPKRRRQFLTAVICGVVACTAFAYVPDAIHRFQHIPVEIGTFYITITLGNIFYDSER